jgi:hypothetical protein
VEDRGELPGGMDAIEDLGVPKPGQRVYMIEIPFHQRNNKNECKKSAEIKPSRETRNYPVSLKTKIRRHRMDGQGWKCFSNN